MRLISFPPVLGKAAKVLILGSMPGQRSLAANQYYAHPRNQFWPIMDKLVGASLHLPYPQRLATLTGVGLALWDVLQHCEREGSLDSRIVASTEVPNDFAKFFREQPSICAVAFNGQKAGKAFATHAMPTLTPATAKRLAFLTLPSTSPANTTQPLTAKVAAWRVILRYLT